MPMPIDLQLTLKNGEKQNCYVPLNLMYAGKDPETAEKTKRYDYWRWTHPTYTIEVQGKLTDIKKVEIDPSKRLADINRNNNVLELNW